MSGFSNILLILNFLIILQLKSAGSLTSNRYCYFKKEFKTTYLSGLFSLTITDSDLFISTWFVSRVDSRFCSTCSRSTRSFVLNWSLFLFRRRWRFVYIFSISWRVFFFFSSSALWIIRSGGVLVKLHVFSSLQIEFKNHNSPWKSALMAVQKRNGSQVACSSLPFTLANKSNVRKRVRSSVLFTS